MATMSKGSAGRGAGAIEGVWVDPPDAAVQLVQHACTSNECLLGARRDGVPLLFRLQPGQAIQPFHAVPPPEHRGPSWDGLSIGPVEPWIAIDRGGRQFAATRTEYQGGSWGIVVYPDTQSPRTEIIPSTTDSDISFGVPHVLRGDELFTLEPGGTGGALWHFRRGSGRWSPTAIPLPRGHDTELAWDLVLSDDAELLFIVSSDQGPRIERFARGADGRFQHDGHIPLPAAGDLAGLSNQSLVFVFQVPRPDGSLIWLVDPRSGATRRTLTFPMNQDPISSLHRAVQGDQMLISQQKTVVLVSLVPETPPCELAIPAPKSGRFELLTAEFMGHHAVVLSNNRVGVFDLRQCP